MRIYNYLHQYIGGYLFMAQSRRPQPQVVECYRESLARLGGKECRLVTDDGQRLSVVHFTNPHAHENSPLLIFCNGTFFHKEEYIAHKYVDVEKWLGKGVNVLLFNNRGVDEQKRVATRDGLILDVKRVLKHALHDLHTQEKHICLHGHSLGAGPATAAALAYPEINVCCDRTFTKLTSLVAAMFGRFAGKIAATILQFFEWEYDVKAKWQEIRGKKWIVHVGPDGVIPRVVQLATSFFDGEQPTILELAKLADNHVRALTDEEMERYIQYMRE